MEESKTTNLKVFGKIFCEHSDCPNQVRHICQVMNSATPEHQFKDDACETFELLKKQKKQRQICNLTLNHEDLETILELLGPSSDEGDPNYDLYWSIRCKMSNPIAHAMYFINFYTIDQQYGGPEEGGWWYHTYDCNWSLGFDCIVGWQSGEPVKDFSRIVDELFSAIEEPDYPAQTKEEIIEFLKTNNHYQYYQVDKYGEGWMIEITQACAGGHNTERQRYS